MTGQTQKEQKSAVRRIAGMPVRFWMNLVKTFTPAKKPDPETICTIGRMDPKELMRLKDSFYAGGSGVLEHGLRRAAAMSLRRAAAMKEILDKMDDFHFDDFMELFRTGIDAGLIEEKAIAKLMEKNLPDNKKIAVFAVICDAGNASLLRKLIDVLRGFRQELRDAIARIAVTAKNQEVNAIGLTLLVEGKSHEESMAAYAYAIEQSTAEYLPRVMERAEGFACRSAETGIDQEAMKTAFEEKLFKRLKHDCENKGIPFGRDYKGIIRGFSIERRMKLLELMAHNRLHSRTICDSIIDELDGVMHADMQKAITAIRHLLRSTIGNGKIEDRLLAAIHKMPAETQDGLFWFAYQQAYGLLESADKKIYLQVCWGILSLPERCHTDELFEKIMESEHAAVGMQFLMMNVLQFSASARKRFETIALKHVKKVLVGLSIRKIREAAKESGRSPREFAENGIRFLERLHEKEKKRMLLATFGSKTYFSIAAVEILSKLPMRFQTAVMWDAAYGAVRSALGSKHPDMREYAEHMVHFFPHRPMTTWQRIRGKSYRSMLMKKCRMPDNAGN